MANNLQLPHSKKEALLARREKVWDLRVVQRMPYRDIAKLLNISVYTAHTDAQWIANNRVKALEGKDKEFVATQNEIYESLLNKWLPVALGQPPIVENAKTDDLEISYEDQLYATDRVTKIMTDQAKLFGFHTLPKAEGGQAKEFGKGIAEGVIEAMARLAAQSKNRVIEAEVVDARIEDAET